MTTSANRLLRNLRDKDDIKCAELILRASKLLRTQINDLLDRTLLEKGRLELHLESLVLINFISDIVEMMSQQAEMKGIKLVLQTKGPIGAYMLD